jgi:hypothetical protein
MPQYQYHCPDNKKTVVIRHCRKSPIQTWGLLCRKARLPLGKTPSETQVSQVCQLPCVTGDCFDCDACCNCTNSRTCAQAENQRQQESA